MRVLFVTLSLLLLALAGCTDSGTENGEGGEEAAAGSETGGVGAGNVTGGPFNASIPLVILTVTVPEGLAPVDVSFNMSISGFADESFVDWTLDVDDDGAAESTGFGGMPFNYTQTFTVGGNYTAVFSADDGDGFADVSVNFTIFAEPVIPPTTQEFSGTIATDDGRCAGAGPATMEGTTKFTMAVDEATWAQSFFAEFSGGFLTSNIDWEDAAGTVILGQDDTDNGEYYEIVGSVPEGAMNAVFYSCLTNALGVVNDFTYVTPA
jgi:hypothetical protein